MDDDNGTRRRGFGAWTPLQRSAAAQAGGRKAHENGTAHEWDKATAAEAGRKGGRACAEMKRLKREADAAEQAATQPHDPNPAA